MLQFRQKDDATVLAGVFPAGAKTPEVHVPEEGHQLGSPGDLLRQDQARGLSLLQGPPGTTQIVAPEIRVENDPELC